MANAITGIRFVCALALIFSPPFSVWFYLLYVIGGISDILDGIAARRLGKETRLGAQLDTIADTAFIVFMLIKVVPQLALHAWIFLWIGCIAIMKCINVLSGLIRYKRLIPEHTVMNKICGVLLFMVPFCVRLFSWRTVEAMIMLICIAATFTAIQEGHFIRTGREIK